MFDTFRKASDTWIVKILFALLILSFGIWGIGDVVRQRITATPAVTVGDRDFTGEEVADRFRRYVDRMAPMFGTKLTPEQARQFGLLQQSINQMVDSALLDQAATNLRLGPDDESLRRSIASLPAFQNQLKMFDKGTYVRILQQNNMTDRQFVALERGDLARTQLIKVVTGGVTAPAALAAPLYRYQAERRVAEFVTFGADKVPAPPVPDQAAEQKYYDDHKVQFQQPEIRSATALVVHAADLAGTVHPSDDEIEKAYQARLAEFQTAEKRTVQQVLFSDEAAAKAFLDKVKGGKDWDAAAKEDKLTSTDLGTVTKADMPLAELGDPAFSSTGPALVGPVQSTLGWHALRVTAIVPGKTKPLSEVKDIIVKDLVKDEATNRLYTLSTKLEDAIGGGNDVEQTAKLIGLSAVKIASVDERGRDAEGKPLNNPAITPDVLGTIFQTVQGATSEVTALPNNDGYYVLHVDKVTPASIKPFDTVRPQVEAALVQEARAASAKQQAEAAAARVKNGEPMSALAGQLKVETTRPFTRQGGPSTQVPPVLIAEMFRQTAVGGVAVVAVGADSMVVRLKEIQTPDTTGAGFDQARTQMADVMTEDLMQQYVLALRKDIGVRVNQSVIDQQFAK
ncbi:MAG TPA: SurA N-terminal domain-containing protein [Magnetospirillaceae bacterium]|nr:SurA N-terminal domain-containing protein [Magnetospirillaceae bacterium]